MKNSDLFLELFDDDLLKPEENLTEQKSKTIQNDNIPKPSTSNSTAVRAEFDICAALDKEKEINEQKHKRFIDKQKGKLDFSREKSLIHSGDTDSSDDEDNKYMDSYNYNEFGRDVKRMLASSENNDSDSGKLDRDTDEQSMKKNLPTIKAKSEPLKSKQSSVKQMSLPDKTAPKTIDVYADPYFGIRIVTPLISSQGIQIRMSGKTAVTLAKLQTHLAKKVDTDFVTAGVIVRSVTKQSQNDNQYMIWEISDLKDDLLVVPVFIFGHSYKDLWKTQIGTVVAILNPTSGNKKGGNGNDSFSVSVKFSDQVMIWGHSKDFGTCKSLKKNGEKCTSFVNRSRCEFCVYHVKKEYSKFSSNRSEIQSPMGGRSMNFLRNKVLGKNEVFYGGNSYTAIKPVSEKAKEKAKKLTPKDQQRLSNLGVTVIENKHEKKSNSISLPLAPRAAQVLRTLNMDSQILKSLSSPDNLSISTLNSPKTKPLNQSTINFKAENNVPKLTNPNLDKSKQVPSLTNPESNSSLNCSLSKTTKLESFSKLEKSFSDSKDIKLRVPSLSNPEKEDKKSSQTESIVSNRSKLLFDEAISKIDSPKSKVKKKLDKPSLSNPEFNESPKNKKELKSNSSRTSKKELFPTSLKSQPPSLSDPSSDSVKSNVQKIDNNDNKKKDLQTKFKSLLSVASGQKRKTIVTDNENTNDLNSECTQTDNDISNKNVDKEKNDLSKSSTTVKEKDNIDSPKSTVRSVDKETEESSVSTSSRKTPTAYKNESTALFPSTSLYQSAAAKKMAKAKARALMFVKRNGPLNKPDPNAIKKSQETCSKKRDRSDSDDGGGDSGKVVFSELYMQLMKQTSQQQDLVEAEKLRMEEEYFEKMGLKEQLEEKMLNTFKIDCKAVKCLQCKYIWFSAADKCKAERHTLKIVDTVKRFFKCGNCGNRTVSLHVVPMFSCKNCSSSNWQRAPMMREKIVKVNNQLSIRGGEQQYINSQATNSNLNLLVPE